MNELSEMIANAARIAFKELFAIHAGNYYYCSLTVTGEFICPVLSAWSYEALNQAFKNERNKEAAHYLDLKWSYVDSPYYAFGEEYFQDVRDYLFSKPDSLTMTDEEWSNEFDLRMSAMESAMRKLDSEGLFGTGDARNNLVVLAEVMPPDYTNTVRGKRLNSDNSLATWLEECAEDIPELEDGHR